jgi:hypothetical protein
MAPVASDAWTLRNHAGVIRGIPNLDNQGRVSRWLLVWLPIGSASMHLISWCILLIDTDAAMTSCVAILPCVGSSLKKPARPSIFGDQSSGID